MEIKTYSDLWFEQVSDSYQAIIRFENNYGVSVLRGGCTITDATHPFELAVIHFDRDGSFSLVYPSYMGNDIVGHLNEDDVTHFMLLVQSM